MKDRFKKFVAIAWHCWLWRYHDWTSAATEGVPPTPEQMRDGVAGFWDYARMYCRRCDVEAEESIRSRERARREAEAFHG